MAELYAKPFETIETGYNPQQPQGGGQSSEADEYLSSLPPEERQAAIQRLNAPLTGEELATLAQSGQKQPSLAEFAEIEKFHKNHEISFIDGLGKIAEGGEQFMTDISKAFGAMMNNPSDVASKMPATAVEAFAQGTRNFYGMLAQSNNTDSTLFKVKDFLNGTGTIEDRYNQYIQALKFNKDSMELMEGKQTMVMDADMINHEVTQAMAYIADPTLFIPFGKVASTGLRAVGLGEKLAMAGARSAAIKNGIIGNTIKWGVGQPLEFMGGAVRNTIDFGLEKAGAALETTTGIGAKEFAQTARMSGIGFSASAVAGYSVPFASTVSDAYIVGSSAKGFGEAITLVGETMKKNKFGRGINSWAAEALEQAEKSGTVLSPHAKGLLKTLNAVDPLFAYGWNGLETAGEGGLIGGTLGYLSGGEEGMYSGIGAGIAMGAVGGTAGKVVADVTGGTNVARRAVQAKMVIEGHKVTNPDKAMFFQAMQTTAEARGQDVDLVNGIIAGIDKVAPNFEFHALTPEQFYNEAKRKGYDPTTGKFKELSALDSEFGGDRASKSKAVSILRSVGGDFVGDRTAFLDALKKASAKDSANPNKPASNIPLALRKYTDVAKTFEKLSKTQQEAVLKEIDGQGAIAKELGGNTRLRDHYDTLTWAEGWTDQLVKKFETDREGSRKDITEMLAQETGKDGKLNRKGRALADKLRAEGFLDRDNKLLRERNLLQADLTISQFAFSKGAVIGRESDGKTHMYINLNSMGDETFPHELFHTIMRESPMKKYFTDSLISKLLGTVDKDGKLSRPAEVNIGQVQKFFKKYIDLTHRNDDGTLDAQASEAKFKLVQEALTEYQNAGSNKQISDKARGLLENYSEEFGAYYFSHWLMGRNRNTLFFGGELKGIEGLVERTKDSFKDFWQSKISKSNPEFDFSKGLNESFDRSKGLGRIASVDYYMRDMVRAASNANREAFRPDSMTLDNLRDFERSNGLRNLTTVDGNRRLNPREQVTQNIRLGKEAFKILSGVDKAMRTSKDVIDENGKQVITGRLSETELDALVKGGIVPRAWADKVNQGYAMLDGTISNVFSAGYLGKTEQTTDASYPRLTGKDVAFKNRKAVLFDVETKVKADGTFYTLFHTLDLAVIEQEANRLFQNTDYRALFDGDRAVMEADFFRYLSNASRASTDPKKLDSAALLEKGDGLGAQRRDVLHQMGRMALQTGDAYKHQPIAVIPEGFRHSVTTFNIDGMTMPRVETGTRYDINMKNAHKFIRENWQPDEMKQEKTPTGVVMTHETGFKFTKDASGRVSAYTDDGSKVGTFGSIKEATTASKNLYNKAQDNIRKIAQVAKQKEVESRKNLQPLDEAFYEEAFSIGDMFKTKRMQEIVGNSRLVRQTFDEFLGQKVEEITSGKNEQEKVAILQQLFSSEFKELIELEAELQKEYEPLQLESRQLQEQEKEIIGRLAEFSQEKKRLQQFSDPDARIDVGILEMFERNYRRKEEVNKRVSEIVKKEHDAGITDYSSHYYMTKRFLQMFKETGKLSEEAISFAMKPQLIKAFEANFETGKAVTFLANHGTPNHELIVSKTFNTEFLGRNTGSLSAFNATFFAGSKETSLAFVGVPLAKTWVRDFIQARPHYVKEFSPELVAKLESMLSSDTSKGVVQKVKYLMKNAHIEFPDDFKLKDTHRKTKEGEPIIASRPESTLGYTIYTLLDRMLENANDEGAVFGGVETYWEEAGRKPYLLRNIVKMDNPYVHEYAKADYRDETFASVIQRAKDAGHDGVIFKNTRDGGGLDTIFASFAKNEDNKIFTLETTEDTRFVPRGNDEAGNKIKNGSEIEGRNYQPTEGGADSVKTKNKITLDANGLLSKLGMNLKDKTKMEIWMRHLTDDPATALEFIREEGLVGWMKNRAQSVIDAEVESWDAGYKELKHQQKVAQQFLDKVESEKIDKPKFQPAEGEQGEPIRLSGKKKTISTKKVSTNQYEMGEGDRTYNTDSRQWTNGFIGRYAEENPILTKGIKLSMKNWDKRTDDYGKRSIELKEGNKLIGRIDYEVKRGSGGKWLLSDPTVRVWEQYRGKGYSNLLYSEMAERARFLGAEDFLQRIENDQALPMFSQVKTFGFGESKLIDADRGQYFPPTKENFDKLKKPLIHIQKQDGNVETMEGYEPWVHSWSKIFSDRHYMPAEAEKAPVKWVTDRFLTEGYNMEIIWMKPSRFLNLAKQLPDEYWKESKGGKERVADIVEKLRSGSEMDKPFLTLDRRHRGSELYIINHEGRHRAKAILELYGDMYIPVEMDFNREELKQINSGAYDFGKPESQKLAGSVSRQVLEDKPLLNEDRTGRFMPDELEVLNIQRTQDMPWFRNLIAGGSYVRYAGVDELNYLRGLHAISHGADTLTGVDVNTTGGRRVVEGKGGLGYALNPNNPAAWASIGKGFINEINGAVRRNIDEAIARGMSRAEAEEKAKTAIMPLVFTTYRKNLNSVQGSEGYYNLFEILRRGNIISDTDLRLAMTKAAEKVSLDPKTKEYEKNQTETLRNIVKNTKYSWDEMLAGIFATLAESDVQNFGTRASMADDFFGAVWSRLDLSKAKEDKIKSIFPEWKTVSAGNKITVGDMKANVADITTDTISKGLKNGDIYAILKFNDFVTDTESNHRSYNTGVIQENGQKPEILILKKPIQYSDFYASSVTSKGEKPLSELGKSQQTNLLGMNARPYGTAKVKLAGQVDFRDVAAKMMPAEFTEFKSEQSATGRILRNAKGYVIMLANNKFRVYNPAKAIIGVYGNEEEAKKRIYKEIPKR